MNTTHQPRSILDLTIGLVVSIALCFGAAALGSLATSSAVDSDWFEQLNKPSFNPPNWIFGPVWSLLYLMMAIAAWQVWKVAGWASAKFALIWFGFHLLLNIGWSVLFFGLREPGWAAIEIFFLWISIAVTIALFYQHSKLAAALLVPYFLWVSFASVLNISIWSLNA